MSTHSNPPAVIVLASGKGERFIASGGKGSKLQALLAGKTVLQWTLDAVRASGLRWHLEDAGHAGMGDSIAAGVRATRDAGGWLILPGDLPLVLPASLLAVAAALGSQATVLPFYRGERGHPVAFPAACGDALSWLSGPEGASSVLQARMKIHSPLRLDLDDPGMVTDIDTLDALAAAEAMLAAERRAAS